MTADFTSDRAYRSRWIRALVVAAVIAATFVVAPPAQAAPPQAGFQAITSNPGEAAGTVNVIVELDTGGPALAAPYTFSVVDLGTGSAGGSDYTYTPANPLTFPIGALDGDTILVPVAISQDALDEDDETIVLEIQAASADITAGFEQHTLTIADDDATPSLSISDGPGGEAATPRQFTVSLSAASGRQVTVDYATSNGTATAGSDYTATSGTLTFVAGDTSETINVPIINDLLDEASPETFTVTLSSPTNATISDATGAGSITDNDDPPTISIADNSGSEGSTPLQLTVSLSAASGQQVTVDYSSSNGTATAPADYTAVSGTVTFVAGDTSETIDVPIVNDLLDENSENFTITLSDPSNATIADGTATGTINDNDGPPTISIADNSGSEGSTPLQLTVSLSAASGQQVTVDYSSSNGTATAPADYTAVSGTVTFTAGDTSETIDVPIVNDLLDENNENFTITLSNPSNASIADGTGIGTINDNDPLPSLSIADGPGGEGSSPRAFVVTLSAASGRSVTVDYTTVNGTATAGADYTATSGTLTFVAGDTSETINVPITDDSFDEASPETFTVTLSNPVRATISDGTGAGTIVDNDDPPDVSIADSSLTESGGSMSFNVTLSEASNRTVTVDYATVAGSATAGSDYTSTSGTVTFTPGDVSEPITVPILNDSRNEELLETFTVVLSNPSLTTILDGTAVGEITDDDPIPSLSVDSPSGLEGDDVEFTVTLSAASGREVTVSYATSNVSAIAGTDYTALTSTPLVFAVGETEKTVSVTTAADLLDEPSETFRLNLSGASNATIAAPGFGVGTIIDNNGAPELTIADAVPVEEGAGLVQLSYTVTLAPVSGQTVTVDYTTADGTATAPGDYTPVTVPTTLTFLAGELTQEILVTVVDDAEDEVDETVLVDLAGAVNAAIADAQAEGMITDDDNVDPDATISITNSGGTPQIEFMTGETVRVSGSFTDPGLADTHTVTIAWGDASPPEVFEIDPVGGRTFERTHSYAGPGFYQVSTTVADADGGSSGNLGFVNVVGSAVTHSTGLVDTSQGRWYLYNSNGSLVTNFYFGTPFDYPFMGDWDGDGIETPGLYRQSDGYVYLRNSNDAGIADIRFFFGNPGDVPIAGDFNGDGKDTVSIYRPSNQTFYIINELGEDDGGLGEADFFYVFGNPGDKPFVGDFDGDGIETVGLHRESDGTVYFRNSHTQGNADALFIYGDPQDRLIAGDWTGDGAFSPALYRPSNRTMYFRYTNTQGPADFQWSGGLSGWLPVSGVTGF